MTGDQKLCVDASHDVKKSTVGGAWNIGIVCCAFHTWAFVVPVELTVVLVQEVMTCWRAQGVTVMMKASEMAAEQREARSLRRFRSINCKEAAGPALNL